MAVAVVPLRIEDVLLRFGAPTSHLPTNPESWSAVKHGGEVLGNNR